MNRSAFCHLVVLVAVVVSLTLANKRNSLYRPSADGGAVLPAVQILDDDEIRRRLGGKVIHLFIILNEDEAAIIQTLRNYDRKLKFA
ncbi:MAG: hypothetical protein A3J59_02690 [Candidatus Buchananbacteria bacterium RIFCSPHIGHO2_02_FULL_56_16]|uniref:Uncharacterized protein n=1 Tax=Candidatus Buchananbacteria bacterium RIFCSPHIGHO2_02_FULL_56_16 TaxID=1797542 RepID=A0A1G1YG58_9BACT|nr:MAG: hypothetical protein A3J59_02690 [Candidatus Buchananbacteria bacterium RIFCSPHIGHO2_02_FULL_56_16]